MAKFNVKHVCGCVVATQIYGPTKDRDRKAEWIGSKPCDACRKKAEQDAADEHAAENGLPELEGSAAQVAWAKVLRHRTLLECGNDIELIEFNLKNYADYGDLPAEVREGMMEAANNAVEFLRSRTSATWWIENRNGVSGPFTYAQSVYSAHRRKERASS